MADLAEVLGTLLSSLAHARRIADEQTVAIAEYYRSTPLLDGMSLPRVRVPEMVVDIPLLVESFEGGGKGASPAPEEVKTKAQEHLLEYSRAVGVKLPKTFLDRFDRELQIELGRWSAPKGGAGRVLSGEAIARTVDSALLRVLKQDEVKRFNRDQEAGLRAELRRRLSTVAPPTEIVPPAFKVTVLTSEVKEKADPQSVVRLRLTLREEGLEWTTVERADGSVARTLTPE